MDPSLAGAPFRLETRNCPVKAATPTHPSKAARLSHLIAAKHADGIGKPARHRACGGNGVGGATRLGSGRDLDLNFSNILASDGRLTGIVDLDHLSGGDDRSVDLATLVFNFEEDRQQFGRPPPAGAVERLKHAIHDISGEAGWRQAVTFRAISDLAWIGLQGQRLPLGSTLAVIEAVIPELDGRTPR